MSIEQPIGQKADDVFLPTWYYKSPHIHFTIGQASKLTLSDTDYNKVFIMPISHTVTCTEFIGLLSLNSLIEALKDKSSKLN